MAQSILWFVFYIGLYTNSLSGEAHETIPKKVTARGEHISHNLTSFHCDGQVNFNISIREKEHMLMLQPVRNFLAPGILIERRQRDVHTRYKPRDKSTNCHFQGIIHGQPDSRVALSACNGLVSSWKIISPRFCIFLYIIYANYSRQVYYTRNTANIILNPRIILSKISNILDMYISCTNDRPSYPHLGKRSAKRSERSITGSVARRSREKWPSK